MTSETLSERDCILRATSVVRRQRLLVDRMRERQSPLLAPAEALLTGYRKALFAMVRSRRIRQGAILDMPPPAVPPQCPPTAHREPADP